MTPEQFLSGTARVLCQAQCEHCFARGYVAIERLVPHQTLAELQAMQRSGARNLAAFLAAGTTTATTNDASVLAEFPDLAGTPSEMYPEAHSRGVDIRCVAPEAGTGPVAVPGEHIERSVPHAGQRILVIAGHVSA